jgi:uncharacterized RDD family membrane protein YckC
MVEERSAAAWELLLEEEFDRLYERLKNEERERSVVVWGGFFLRAAAFSIDMTLVAALLLVLSYLVYVGYSVGLAAHQRALSREHLEVLLFFSLAGWLSLVTGYFVLLHGMAGQTVGKWLLGLKVVGAGQGPITYRQALIRWAGSWIAAAMGAGLLWILFHPQKRGWHDLLAGTWVIREKKSR